jgi:signal transduction histidine kinase
MQNASGKNLLVKVKDHGVGIPKKDQPFIFDKFYRTEESSKISRDWYWPLYICRYTGAA